MKVLYEYIWIDGSNSLRSKTRVLSDIYESESSIRDVPGKSPGLGALKGSDIRDVPWWNYDGSSTNQAPTEKSEVLLRPIFICPDPLRGPPHQLVLCDTWKSEKEPHPTNFNVYAKQIFHQKKHLKPWFGLEQEYFMIDGFTNSIIGSEKTNMSGKFYCGVGTHDRARKIAEKHLQACLKANLKISGINAEVANSQWEFQIGPCEGIEIGHMMWVARYLLMRVAEEENILIDFSPKPFHSENGSGCHVNYSTIYMREHEYDEFRIVKTGLKHIEEAIDKLSHKHHDHMLIYGEGNEDRMTGKNETATYEDFSVGYGDRGRSIRVGTDTLKNQRGYLEDRRPASNIDPYLVCAKIFETTCL